MHDKRQFCLVGFTAPTTPQKTTPPPTITPPATALEVNQETSTAAALNRCLHKLTARSKAGRVAI